MEISKELLSEVLSIKVFTEISENDYGKNNILVYWEFDGYHNHCRNINIYELANKCKEWAYSQGYILFSKIRLSSSLASCYFDVMGKHDYEDSYHNDFRAETESEAIFKACEWILTKDSK